MHYGLPTDDVKLRSVPYHYKANGSRLFLLLFGGCFPLSFPFIDWKRP